MADKWTTEELEKIGNAEELDLENVKSDGTLRKPVTIWVVKVGDNIYVRSVKGKEGLWYRHAVENHKGHIRAGGMEKEVSFGEAEDSINDRVDAAYKTKYGRYTDSIVGSVLTTQARSATLRLDPG